MVVKELCELYVEEFRFEFKEKVRKLCLRTLVYSYASVSLTVKREALLAGRALAKVPNTIVKINQAITPLAPYTTGIGAVRIAIPTPKHNTFVIGMAINMLIAQLTMPMAMPSVMTMA